MNLHYTHADRDFSPTQPATLHVLRPPNPPLILTQPLPILPPPRPPLPRLLTQLPPFPPPIPILSLPPHHPPHPKIPPPLPAIKQLLPPPYRLLHLPPCHPRLPLPPQLPFLRRDHLIGVIDRDEHLLHTAQVSSQVGGETSCDEGAGGVAAGEEGVRPAGPVEVWGGGDVVDGAVEGEVDGEVGGGAVVEEELGGGECNGTALTYRQSELLLRRATYDPGAYPSGTRPCGSVAPGEGVGGYEVG